MGIRDILGKKKEKKKKEEKKKETKKLEKKISPKKREEVSIAWRILKGPWITEKSTELQKQGKYVFEVDYKATKEDIKKAIESYYNVKVKKVNVIKVKEKIRRLGRIVGKTKRRKKAIITLEKGEVLKIE